MSKRVLIVSPHFPPVNAPDMQRVRVSLPDFVEAGWDVTVLTVDDPTPTAPLEPELLATVPAAVRVERVRCCSRAWTGKLGVNNVALRSLPFLFLRGCRLLASKHYDVVYFSTTMFIVLGFGRLWKRLYGVPYVIDLQDPWVTDYYDRPGSPPPPGGWKYRVAHALGLALEGWTMSKVSRLIVVSASYGDTLRSRYPGMRAVPVTELPFGAPEPDLAWVRQQLPARRPLLPAGGLRLGFAGALGPGMFGSVEALFAALAGLRDSHPALSVHFFGTTYSHIAGAETPVHALAARHGVGHLVHEQPSRLRYLDALQVTLEADVNLLFGSTDLAFTPSKILAVLATEKPVLAIAPAGSAMIARLENLEHSCCPISGDTPQPSEIGDIANRLRSLCAEPNPGSRPSRDALAPFSARELALRQLDILQAAALAG